MKKSVLVSILLNIIVIGGGFMYAGKPVLGILLLFISIIFIVFTDGLAVFIVYPVAIFLGMLFVCEHNSQIKQRAKW